MPKYLTIGENLQIVRGEGCGFLPGESPNDLESAQRRVSAWIEQNGAHSDVNEATEMAGGGRAKLEIVRKEDELRHRLDQYRQRIERTTPWPFKRYIKEYEKKLRDEMGLN